MCNYVEPAKKSWHARSTHVKKTLLRTISTSSFKKSVCIIGLGSIHYFLLSHRIYLPLLIIHSASADTSGDESAAKYLEMSAILGVLGHICRHGKSRKHASNACGQFLKKLWTFLDKQQFSCSVCPKVVIIIHNSSFLLENIWYNEKNSNFRQFYFLKNYENLRTFLNPENWLADKNLFFPCLP